MSLSMIHVSAGAIHSGLWTDVFCRELRALGSLEIVENGKALPERDLLEKMRQTDVILGGWGSVIIPPDLAVHPGRVRYICSVTGSVKFFVSKAHVEAGLLVTNWGNAIALNVAEGAMCLLLATLKDLHAQIMAVRNGGFALDATRYGGSLEDLNVGIYGFGAIGRKFSELLVPFGCTIRCFDPYVTDFPPHIIPVESLETLFRESEAIAIHAGLNDQTKGTVTRELLALLPRHGVLINTARGDIVDQEALFDEVRSGRLRAGLDVLKHPEYLEPEDPIRKNEGLIWTCHKIGRSWPLDGLPAKKLTAMHKVCLDNIRRFKAGQPLRFVMDAKRYDLST